MYSLYFIFTFVLAFLVVSIGFLWILHLKIKEEKSKNDLIYNHLKDLVYKLDKNLSENDYKLACIKNDIVLYCQNIDILRKKIAEMGEIVEKTTKA